MIIVNDNSADHGRARVLAERWFDLYEAVESGQLSAGDANLELVPIRAELRAVSDRLAAWERAQL